MANSLPEGVTTELGDTTVSASAIVDATPSEVFEFLRRPENHASISGDASVRGAVSGPERLGPGSRFRMRMKVIAPYLVSNKVVEFDEDRAIAWCHLGGHRWRWELEPIGDGRTRVTETFDQSTSKLAPVLRAAGYPRRHLPNVANSVANVAARFAATASDRA
jgi:hypothetical protein